MNINDLFKIAVEKEASDLHIVVGMPPVLRVDGNLHEIENTSVLEQKSAQDLIFSILSEKQKDIFIRERELDISYDIKKCFKIQS